MQILIYVFLGISVLVATFFWIKYELECEHSYELEDKLCEANYELKKRTKLTLIANKVQEYKKGGNVYTVMKDISDIIANEKVKELASRPIDNKF